MPAMFIPRLVVSGPELSPVAQSALLLPTVVLAAAAPASLCEFMRVHATGGCIGRWWLEPSTDAEGSDQAALRHWPLETEVELLNVGAARVMADIRLSATASPPDAETLAGLATTPVERRIIRLVTKDIEELQAVANSSTSWVTAALPSLTNQVLIQLPAHLATSPAGRDTLQALQGRLAQLPQPIALAVQLDGAGVALTGLQQCFAADQSVVYAIDGLSTAWPAPPGHLNLAEALLAGAQSDRADRLIPTVVVNAQRVNLGLVYSSAHSLSEALRTGTGVYQSRKRGLWYKGQTSGATQQLLRVSVDCDADALEVIVAQTAPGFCHLNRSSCFGESVGLTRLAETLAQRKQEAVAGSYTQRLFDDPALLRAKIMEEAEELCDATEPNDIAWEAADVIYFALAKCVAHGISLSDVEAHIDARAMKVTRRPGNAKRKWQAAAAQEVQPPANVTAAGFPDTPARIAMVHHTLADLSVDQQRVLFQRPIIQSDSIMATVEPIVRDVRTRGDSALKHYTEKFDKVAVEHTVLQAPFGPDLLQGLSDSVRAAIDQAYANIRAFHEAQLPQQVLTVETMPGVVCSRFSRPIERVGLYVPGGSAVLPSSALMLGVPAQVAGCRNIVLATPPRRDGSIVPEVLYAAQKCGVSTVVVAGGAQAVAAMAYGTESVPKVDKICGPGNQFVTAAKMMAQNDHSAMVAIDMPAGPSELLVIADKDCNPAYVASDLLSQAEHGPDSQVVLVAVDLSPDQLQAIDDQVHAQASRLPRVAIVRQSIPKSYCLSVATRAEAIRFSNDYAPEHLILHVEQPEALVADVTNAGSVFVGPYSPESCGDYASGTNHTLPTYGYARMYSGVNTDTFLKHITSQALTAEGLNRIGDTVMALAEVEELEAHRNAVAIRLRDLRQ